MTLDLSYVGLQITGPVHRNLSATLLVEHALRREEGPLSAGGALVTRTGNYTGRSPNDTFTVRDPETARSVWWGDINRPFTPEAFDTLHQQILAYLQGKEVFVQDCYTGADQEQRLAVRVFNERAWHNIFARNMFRQPTEDDDLDQFQPGFTVLHAPGFKSNPEVDGTNSKAAVVVNFACRLVLICGTECAGEIKKSIFTVLN